MKPGHVPTMIANRFAVEAGQRVRIAFGEQHEGEDAYHQAVSLSREDALELANLLVILSAGGDLARPSNHEVNQPEMEVR